MYNNFPDKELQCKCGCGEQGMQHSFMKWLVVLRTVVGFALPLSSAYRCDQHPEEKKKAKPGVHPLGLAVDIQIFGARAILLLAAVFALKLLGAPFYGIGVSQRGTYKNRFIHIDGLPPENILSKPRPTLWSY